MLAPGSSLRTCPAGTTCSIASLKNVTSSVPNASESVALHSLIANRPPPRLMMSSVLSEDASG